MKNKHAPILHKPELLCPAGDLEKLKIALSYGADAVYIGTHIFGLRRYATNFTIEQLRSGIQFANSKHKKVYIVLNGFAHQTDLENLSQYFVTINQLNPHGLIISDMGVFQLAKQHTSLPLHISTQASVTNKYTCQFWKKQGASRIILARETSIKECQLIQKFCNIELEVFIHGAMCASYSGKCTISNYTAGRDSNRGGCIQSCRHHYTINDHTRPHKKASLSMMNAQDLMGIRQIPKLIKSQITSLKIEGRMKSNLYVANCSAVYRQAIDHCYDKLKLQSVIPEKQFLKWEFQLNQVSNRTFTSGGLEKNLHINNSIHYHFEKYEKTIEYLGTIKAITKNKNQPLIIVAVKNTFKLGDTVELMNQNGKVTPLTIKLLQNSKGSPIKKTNPNTIVKINGPNNATIYDILRQPLSQTRANVS